MQLSPTTIRIVFPGSGSTIKVDFPNEHYVLTGCPKMVEALREFLKPDMAFEDVRAKKLAIVSAFKTADSDCGCGG